jgi:putative membrane protein
MKIALSAFAALAILASPAPAQTTTAAPSGVSAVPDAKSFVSRTGVSNLFEIQSSRLALLKATKPDVKQFAQMMVDEHTRTSDALTVAAQAANETDPPQRLDAAHEELLGRLNSASDFDREYVEAQTKVHQDAISLFDTYSTKGESAALKQFAAKTLPDLQKHLDAVQKLSRSVP